MSSRKPESSLPALQWVKRPKRQETAVGYKRIWNSLCHKYRVEEITPIGGLAKCYYALVNEGDKWHPKWVFVDRLPTRYRSRKTACEACLRHLRQGVTETKKIVRKKSVSREGRA